MGNNLEKRIWLMFMTMFVFSVAIIYLYLFTIHSAVESNRSEKEQSIMQASNLEMRSKETRDRTADVQNRYEAWMEQNETANSFVEESNGKLKKSWALFLVQEAEAFDINPNIPYELLKVETGGTFDPELTGPKTEYGRAYGMGQFMKNTAPWIADKSGVEYEDELLFDPYYSIHLTLSYLDFLYDKYDDWEQTLTAYHRGIAGMETYVEENGDARSWYAAEILSEAQ